MCCMNMLHAGTHYLPWYLNVTTTLNFLRLYGAFTQICTNKTSILLWKVTIVSLRHYGIYRSSLFECFSSSSEVYIADLLSSLRPLAIKAFFLHHSYLSALISVRILYILEVVQCEQGVVLQHWCEWATKAKRKAVC